MLTGAALLLGLWAVQLPAAVTILPIGDSTTMGNVSSPTYFTYRPYLEQTAQNFLNLPGGNPNGIPNPDFVGDFRPGESAMTAPTPTGGNTPFPIDSDWDYDHEGIGGSSSLTYANNWITDAVTHLSGSDQNVATVVLGANDGTVLKFDNYGGFMRHGWNISQTPLKNVMQNNGSQGYIMDVVDALVAADSNIEILLAATPHVDTRKQFVYGSTTNTFYWTELDRETIRVNAGGTGPIPGYVTDIVTWEGGQWVDSRLATTPDGHTGVDNNGDPADVNDVIDVTNRTLAAYAASHSNVTFVNPLEQNPANIPGGSWTLVGPNAGSPNVTVDGGGVFDLPVNGSVSDDLVDGLHMSFSGDQYYAAAFWEGGLRSIIATASGSAIPEPSSFAFLGLIATAGCVAKRVRRKGKTKEVAETTKA